MNPLLVVEDLHVTFSVQGQPLHAVRGISFEVGMGEAVGIVGESGCGKSAAVQALMGLTPGKVSGKISFDGKKNQIGMVFQRPNPFPKSIIQNVTWGPKINGLLKNADELVQQALTQAALWDEVKDRLHESALNLSGGQQQRLCIARAIAMNPEVILMDEPCSALDPNATARIEDLIGQLSERYTIVIVTHNMQQAARVSKMTAFFTMENLLNTTKLKIFLPNRR